MEKRRLSHSSTATTLIYPKPTQPRFFTVFFLYSQKKGREIDFLFAASFYGRFRSIIITTKARTMMIKTNSPAIAGTKYVSATDVAVVAVGVDVDAGVPA
jgi:hypothetical protein